MSFLFQNGNPEPIAEPPANEALMIQQFLNATAGTQTFFGHINRSSQYDIDPVSHSAQFVFSGDFRPLHAILENWSNSTTRVQGKDIADRHGAVIIISHAQSGPLDTALIQIDETLLQRYKTMDIWHATRVVDGARTLSLIERASNRPGIDAFLPFNSFNIPTATFKQMVVTVFAPGKDRGKAAIDHYGELFAAVNCVPASASPPQLQPLAPPAPVAAHNAHADANSTTAILASLARGQELMLAQHAAHVNAPIPSLLDQQGKNRILLVCRFCPPVADQCTANPKSFNRHTLAAFVKTIFVSNAFHQSIDICEQLGQFQFSTDKGKKNHPIKLFRAANYLEESVPVSFEQQLSVLTRVFQILCAGTPILQLMNQSIDNLLRYYNQLPPPARDAIAPTALELLLEAFETFVNSTSISAAALVNQYPFGWFTGDSPLYAQLVAAQTRHMLALVEKVAAGNTPAKRKYAPAASSRAVSTPTMAKRQKANPPASAAAPKIDRSSPLHGICSFVVLGESCPHGDRCRFKHDLPTPRPAQGFFDEAIARIHKSREKA